MFFFFSGDLLAPRKTPQEIAGLLKGLAGLGETNSWLQNTWIIRPAIFLEGFFWVPLGLALDFHLKKPRISTDFLWAKTAIQPTPQRHALGEGHGSNSWPLAKAGPKLFVPLSECCRCIYVNMVYVDIYM